MSGRERNTACASGDGSERGSRWISSPRRAVALSAVVAPRIARPTSCVAHVDLGVERDLVEKSPFRRAAAAASQRPLIECVVHTHARATGGARALCVR